MKTTRRSVSFALAFLASASALAQSAPSPAAPAASAAAVDPSNNTLAPVVVTGKSPVPASVAGFGDVPLSRAPLQAATVDAQQIRDAGARRLSDLVRFDAAVSDAYDTEGYVDYFTVRGFVVDNRFNFRRDGLPINAETSIPLDNKARVDILKGTSGIQSGTSAPGGLVDLIVKRPTDAPVSSAFLEWRQRGSVLGSVDLSRRFGEGAAFGVRVNAAAESIDPEVRNARGSRRMAALAGDWRATSSTLVEAEVETSHRSQPSVPGFSVLGDRVPDVPDPRLSLNNQRWSLPVVFDANTASLRGTQQLAPGWRVVAHGLTQRLRTDDRIAFPFGCTGGDGTYYADRYCPDGTFDLYDFRSDGERRREDALDVTLHGTAATGPLAHTFTVGALRSVVRNRFRQSAFNYAGTGNVDGTLQVPSAADLTTPNTNRDERSTELHLSDRIGLGERTAVWLGARTTRLFRSSVGTDGSAPTDYRQSFTSPFVAATRELVVGQLVYASWSRGVESDVAPNVAVASADGATTGPRYANAGQALAAARSRQVELGWKGAGERSDWNVALFDIRRPLFGDLGPCDAPGTCTRALDGEQHHRGLDANAAWRAGAWQLHGGVQWLRATTEGRADASLDGKRPTNVPAFTARVGVDYSVAAMQGLALQVAGSYESAREVLPDNSLRIPSVTRVDTGARIERRVAGVAWTLRAGIDNLFDRRAWRESPDQFSHAYLFPLAPRTARISLQAEL